MSLTLANITDTLTNITQKVDVPVESSSLAVLTDKQIKRRNIMRVVVALFILAIIAFITYSIKK